MSTAILVAAGIIGYLNIGYWWGRASKKAWETKQRSVAGLLCFPVSYANNRLVERYGRSGFPAVALWEENNYLLVMSFGWPVKLMWNTVILTGLTLYKTVATTATLVTNPLSLFPKRQIQELPAAQTIKPEPDSELDPNGFDIHEYHRLLEQKVKIDARIKELEEHPDRKNVVAFPKRL